MHRAILVPAVFCLSLFALGPTAPALGALLAVNFGGGNTVPSQLFSVNEATGAATAIGSTGSFALNSLAATPAGELYTVGTSPGTSGSLANVLLRINPATGAATPVATLSLGGGRNGASIRAMAFSPAGVLFAVYSSNPPGSSVFAVPELFTINPSSGVGTLVGSLGEHAVQAMDFSPGGVLYGYALNATVGGAGVGLVTINPATAAVADVNPAVPGTTNGQGLSFTPDGTLYGGNTTLVRIDPATAIETSIGPTGADLRGFEVVPEPSAAFGLAAAALAATGRRRRVRLIRTRADVFLPLPSSIVPPRSR